MITCSWGLLKRNKSVLYLRYRSCHPFCVPGKPEYTNTYYVFSSKALIDDYLTERWAAANSALQASVSGLKKDSMLPRLPKLSSHPSLSKILSLPISLVQQQAEKHIFCFQYLSVKGKWKLSTPLDASELKMVKSRLNEVYKWQEIIEVNIILQMYVFL